MLSPKTFAEKYSGGIFNCKVNKSTPVFDNKPGIKVSSFDGRIVGWKKSSPRDLHEYIIVEVLPPHKTNYLLSDFGGCIFTHKDYNKKGYGKRLYVEEVEIPSNDTTKKVIPEWPNKCKDCGSPAYVGSSMIDCSNKDCKNKFSTRSGLDLFLPKEMREWDKPLIKERAGIDKDGFIICPTCKSRAYSGTRVNTKLTTICGNKHRWTAVMEKNDKLEGINKRILVFNGKVLIAEKLKK